MQYAILAPGSQPIGLLDGLGLLVFIIGFACEVLADWQLARFKADPANTGKVMDQGLWAWSRHPNYFGESLIWWGLFIITLSAPGAFWFILSPLLMTFLLVKVSGKDLLEQGLKKTKPGYADYIARTSGFIPWPPKQKQS